MIHYLRLNVTDFLSLHPLIERNNHYCHYNHLGILSLPTNMYIYIRDMFYVSVCFFIDLLFTGILSSHFLILFPWK